jgi:hypothetical protein
MQKVEYAFSVTKTRFGDRAGSSTGYCIIHQRLGMTSITALGIEYWTQTVGWSVRNLKLGLPDRKCHRLVTGQAGQRIPKLRGISREFGSAHRWGVISVRCHASSRRYTQGLRCQTASSQEAH